MACLGKVRQGNWERVTGREGKGERQRKVRGDPREEEEDSRAVQKQTPIQSLGIETGKETTTGEPQVEC